MKRTTKVRRLELVVVTAASIGVAWWGAATVLDKYGRHDPDDIPVATVAEEHFLLKVEAEGSLRPSRSTTVSSPAGARDAMMIVWVIEDGSVVKKGDVLLRLDGDEISRRLADIQSEGAAAHGRIDREQTMSDSQLAERDRSAALTNTELESARALGKLDPRFFPRAEIIQSELDDKLYEARLKHAAKARKLEERLNRTKVDLMAVEQRRANLMARQTQNVLQALEIRAPHDGTFVLRRWGRERSRSGRGTLGSGDRVLPGMRIAEVSASDEMQAEVFVLEADAGGLKAGRPATVVLDAHPDQVWKAQVTMVDTLPSRRLADVPAQYFRALLDLEGDTSGLKPGQPLRATVIVEEHPRALVVPRQAVIRADHEVRVYRRADDGFRPVKVKVGPGTVGRLVITDGLSPGDVVALRDPTISAEEAMARRREANKAGAGGQAGGEVGGSKGLLP